MLKGTASDRKAVIDRLRRLEGQVRALERMIDEDADCDKVLMQFAAARSAFQKVGIETLSLAMRDCAAFHGGIEDEEALERALAVFDRYARHLQ